MGLIIAFLIIIIIVLFCMIFYFYVPDCSEIVEDGVEQYFGFREYLPKKLSDQLTDVNFKRLIEKKKTFNHIYNIDPVKQNCLLLAMVNNDADVFYDYKQITQVIAQTPNYKIYVIKVSPQPKAVPLILSTSSKPYAYIGYRSL
jgi:hypothetical protein